MPDLIIQSMEQLRTIAGGAYQDIIGIKIQNQPLQQADIEFIAKILPTTKKLEFLHLERTQIKAFGIQTLMKVIVSENAPTSLKTLNLDGNQLDNEGLEFIVQALTSGKWRSNLTTFKLAGDNLSKEMIKVLAPALLSGKCPTQLAGNFQSQLKNYFRDGEAGVKLMVDTIIGGRWPDAVPALQLLQFDDELCRALMKIINEGKWPTSLTSIVFINTTITDEGAALLAQTLSGGKWPPTLTTFVPMGSPKLATESFEALVRVLLSGKFPEKLLAGLPDSSGHTILVGFSRYIYTYFRELAGQAGFKLAIDTIEDGRWPSTLTNLPVRPVNDEEFAILASTITGGKWPSTLTYFSLENTNTRIYSQENTSISDEGALAIAQAISSGKWPATLTKFSLEERSIFNANAFLSDKGTAPLVPIRNKGAEALFNAFLSDKAPAPLVSNMQPIIVRYFRQIGPSSLKVACEAIENNRWPSGAITLPNFPANDAECVLFIKLIMHRKWVMDSPNLSFKNSSISNDTIRFLAELITSEKLPLGFTSLILSDTPLDDVGMGILLEAIIDGRWPAKLRHIDLSKTKIGDAGAKKLAQALTSGKWPATLTIWLTEIAIGDEGTQILAQAFLSEKCPPKCGFLMPYLQKYLLKAGSAGIKLALDFIEKGRWPVSYGQLSLDSLTDESCQAMVEVICSGRWPSTLISIAFSSIKITDHGAKILAQALSSGKWPATLTTFNINSDKGHMLGIEGNRALTYTCFSGSCPAQLILSFKKYIDQYFKLVGEKGLTIIIDAIEGNRWPTSMTTLPQISLSNAGCSALFKTVIGGKWPAALTSLNLSNAKIGDAGAKVIAEALTSGRWPATLIALSLSNAEIGDAGAKVIAEALTSGKWPTTLTIFGLEKNYIGDEGAKALTHAFFSGKCPSGLYSSLYEYITRYINSSGDEGLKVVIDAIEGGRWPQKVTLLNFANQHLGDNGAAALAKSITSGKWPAYLTSISLSNTKMGDAGAKAIADALASGKWPATLTVLHLDGNTIGNDGAEALTYAFFSGKCSADHYSRLYEYIKRYFKSAGEAGLKMVIDAIAGDRWPPFFDTLPITRWTNDGCNAVIEAICSGKWPRQVTALNFENQPIGDNSITNLAKAITSGKWPASLDTISLSNTQIGDAGISALISAIISGRWPKTLRFISLNKINLWVEGTKTLADAIASGKWPASIGSFDLTGVDISVEGAQILLPSLLSGMCSAHIVASLLSSIKEQLNKNSKVALKLILEAIEVERFPDNFAVFPITQVNDAGCARLATSIISEKWPKLINSLSFDHPALGDNGAKSLAAALASDKWPRTLTAISFKKNQISDAGALLLIDALEFNFVITKLDLSQCNIKPALLARLNELCERNKNGGKIYKPVADNVTLLSPAKPERKTTAPSSIPPVTISTTKTEQKISTSPIATEWEMFNSFKNNPRDEQFFDEKTVNIHHPKKTEHTAITQPTPALQNTSTVADVDALQKLLANYSWKKNGNSLATVVSCSVNDEEQQEQVRKTIHNYVFQVNQLIAKSGIANAQASYGYDKLLKAYRIIVNQVTPAFTTLTTPTAKATVPTVIPPLSPTIGSPLAETTAEVAAYQHLLIQTEKSNSVRPVTPAEHKQALQEMESIIERFGSYSPATISMGTPTILAGIVHAIVVQQHQHSQELQSKEQFETFMRQELEKSELVHAYLLRQVEELEHATGYTGQASIEQTYIDSQPVLKQYQNILLRELTAVLAAAPAIYSGLIVAAPSIKSKAAGWGQALLEEVWGIGIVFKLLLMAYQEKDAIDQQIHLSRFTRLFNNTQQQGIKAIIRMVRQITIANREALLTTVNATSQVTPELSVWQKLWAKLKEIPEIPGKLSNAANKLKRMALDSTSFKEHETQALYAASKFIDKFAYSETSKKVACALNIEADVTTTLITSLLANDERHTDEEIMAAGLMRIWFAKEDYVYTCPPTLLTSETSTSTTTGSGRSSLTLPHHVVSPQPKPISSPQTTLNSELKQRLIPRRQQSEAHQQQRELSSAIIPVAPPVTTPSSYTHLEVSAAQEHHRHAILPKIRADLATYQDNTALFFAKKHKEVQDKLSFELQRQWIAMAAAYEAITTNAGTPTLASYLTLKLRANLVACYAAQHNLLEQSQQAPSCLGLTVTTQHQPMARNTIIQRIIPSQISKTIFSAITALTSELETSLRHCLAENTYLASLNVTELQAVAQVGVEIILQWIINQSDESITTQVLLQALFVRNKVHNSQVVDHPLFYRDLDIRVTQAEEVVDYRYYKLTAAAFGYRHVLASETPDSLERMLYIKLGKPLITVVAPVVALPPQVRQVSSPPIIIPAAPHTLPTKQKNTVWLNVSVVTGNLTFQFHSAESAQYFFQQLPSGSRQDCVDNLVTVYEHTVNAINAICNYINKEHQQWFTVIEPLRNYLWQRSSPKVLDWMSSVSKINKIQTTLQIIGVILREEPQSSEQIRTKLTVEELTRLDEKGRELLTAYELMSKRLAEKIHASQNSLVSSEGTLDSSALCYDQQTRPVF